MKYPRIYGSLSEVAARVITRGRMIGLTMVVAFSTVGMQPAQAQTSDMWKSAVIIGGATAAGAYVGDKVAGRTGAYIGAGIGATAGYAIDRRRRQNEAYNQGYYPDNGNNTGYYDPNGGYYGNGYPGPYDNGAYPGGYPYQGNSYTGSTSRSSYARRARR